MYQITFIGVRDECCSQDAKKKPCQRSHLCVRNVGQPTCKRTHKLRMCREDTCK
jgi:hypothetical protein